MQYKCLRCDELVSSKLVGDDKDAVLELMKECEKHNLEKHPDEWKSYLDSVKEVSECLLVMGSWMMFTAFIDTEHSKTSHILIQTYDALDEKIDPLVTIFTSEDELEETEDNKT